MTDLPNCPHCGSPPDVYPNADGTVNYIYCSTCGTRVPGRKWCSYAQIETEEARAIARRYYHLYRLEREQHQEFVSWLIDNDVPCPDERT